MRVTQRVKKLLSQYDGENPGSKSALARILMEGKLGGTGRALILPIDHAFSKTMVPKFSGADPEYHFQLAVDAGLSALAAPLAMLEVAADSFAGSIPLILQLQTGAPFTPKSRNAGSVRDALRLGCIGISCAISTDHDNSDVTGLVTEAKSHGLAVMIWASAGAETQNSRDSVAKAASIAAQLGAHLICVRVPDNAPGTAATVTAPQSDLIRHVRMACSHGRRMVVFAGDNIDDDTVLFDELRGVRDGGGQGYVLPPNSLYRPYDQSLSMLDTSISVYLGKA